MRLGSFTALVSITALTIACSSTDDAARDASIGDAGLARDAGDLDDAGSFDDAQIVVDAEVPDTSTIVDAGSTELAATCEGDCTRNDAVIRFGAATGGFERAFYGISSPAQSSSGDYELHIEVLMGGSQDCPEMTSPTPDWNLVVTLPLFGVEPLTEAGGAITFLDFDGRFVTGPRPLTRATAFTATPAAASVCTSCLGNGRPSHPDGFVAFDLDATFAEGTIRGHVFATHCDSFDAP